MSEAIAVELDGQYRQLREECGLLERSERGKLLVHGPEAGEYLQGQLTNDIEAMAVGDGVYAALLDRKGHMQADMRVLRLADGEFWVDTEAVATAAALRHLQMYKIGREVEVDDVGEGRAIFSLIGPRSAQIAGIGGLPEFANETGTIAGAECVLVGTSNGVDVLAPAAGAAAVREALLGAGAVAVGPEAVEILRIESGVPRFGAEMTNATMPAEAGIVEAAVSFTKGCYIGQEPVARLHYKGRPNRHLRGLLLSRLVATGTPLLLGEKAVGEVGGVCLSPAHGAIALAIVRREAEPGAELSAGEDGVTARVIDLPFG